MNQRDRDNTRIRLFADFVNNLGVAVVGGSLLGVLFWLTQSDNLIDRDYVLSYIIIISTLFSGSTLHLTAQAAIGHMK